MRKICKIVYAALVLVFLEAMAYAGKSVSDYLGNGDRIIYINVMNNLSVDCDGHASDPEWQRFSFLRIGI